jgi:hypothetical protein
MTVIKSFKTTPDKIIPIEKKSPLFEASFIPNESQEILPDSDIFEIIEAYFKICRKYHLPTFEEL